MARKQEVAAQRVVEQTFKDRCKRRRWMEKRKRKK